MSAFVQKTENYKYFLFAVEAKIMDTVNINRRKITKSALIQGICFALCFFTFQLAEFTVNDKAAALVGDKVQ